jgi:NADH:ubiquinone oxidoreductase subunit 5 (subunit L)/multisubunit Na+/H+ antiporter MnhA subunit
MKDLLWLIPLFPLLGAVVNGLVGNRRGWEHRTTSAVALVGSGLAMAAAFAAITDGRPRWAFKRPRQSVFTWIPLAPHSLRTDCSRTSRLISVFVWMRFRR